MTHSSRSRKSFLVGIACLTALALCLTTGSGSRSMAQKKDDAKTGKKKDDGDVKPDAKNWKWHGAGDCVRCHTVGPTANDDNFVLLTEYATWRTQDKHSFAYLVLLGERAQQMGKLLGITVTEDRACLSCHSSYIKEEQQGTAYQKADGVSCDGCHGPSAQWVGPHTDKSWRLKTPDEKAAFGLNNLRDPVKRTEICVTCHVGNTEQGKVVTHAMYAAGHPPLPAFEVASFSRRLPPHWRERKDIKFLTDPPAKLGGLKIDKDLITKLYHMKSADFQQTQLAAASSLEGLRGALKFVADRANLPQGQKQDDWAVQWPELKMAGFANLGLPELWPQLAMGQADCYACHHDLQRPTNGKPNWRQLRGYSGPPGRPQVRPWPYALAKQGLGLENADPMLRQKIAALHAACNGQPFGDPRQINQAAAEIAAWAETGLKARDLADAEFSRPKLLRQLCTLEGTELLDYDSARQLAAAIVAIHEDGYGAKKDDPLKEKMDQLKDTFYLTGLDDRRKRLLLVKSVLDTRAKTKFLTAKGAVEAMENLSDHVLTAEAKKLVNDFLSAVRDQGEAFDEKNQAFIKELDKIDEAELAAMMGKVADYHPQAFRQTLAELAKQLPAE